MKIGNSVQWNGGTKFASKLTKFALKVTIPLNSKSSRTKHKRPFEGQITVNPTYAHMQIRYIHKEMHTICSRDVRDITNAEYFALSFTDHKRFIILTLKQNWACFTDFNCIAPITIKKTN